MLKAISKEKTSQILLSFQLAKTVTIQKMRSKAVRKKYQDLDSLLFKLRLSPLLTLASWEHNEQYNTGDLRIFLEVMQALAGFVC